ncbi:MAG: hypothetical protein FWB75_00460 [Oscillospiraceae bacterium]|nr:hypothetical protein [Oscillospiraceae bacterium]
MSSEKLFDALSDVRDGFITEALTYKPRKPSAHVIRWVAVAAVLALAVGLSTMFFIDHGLPLPPGGTAGGGSAAVTGPDNSTVFMSYAGPVFPLTLTDSAEGIQAKRSITFDFTEFGQPGALDSGIGLHANDIRVRDSYILTNTTSNDMTVQFAYPFAGSFAELDRLLPTISVGQAGLPVADTTLLAGAFSGGFQGIEGHEDEYINLRLITQWQDYVTLLSDSSYLRRAMTKAPRLDQSVIVYSFTDLTADHAASINPTLAVGFNLDYSRTTVLSYGFHGASIDPDAGFMRQSFSIPRADLLTHERTFKLIVLGDDITDINMLGFANAGWNPDEERDDITAVMTRSEARLGDVFEQLVNEFLGFRAPYVLGYDTWGFSAQLFHRAAAELLLDFGMLADNTARRYQTGWLEEIFSEALMMTRVFYLTAELTIPAGQSVEVTVDMIKAGSFDFFGAGSRNQGLTGYDMMTTLGSNLEFTSPIANIKGYDSIVIENQNFGFDLERGITNVYLDINVPRYFIEVVRAPSPTR